MQASQGTSDDKVQPTAPPAARRTASCVGAWATIRICGRCKAKVFPRQPVAVTDAGWKREVEDSPIPVLVDFRAPWCGPCRLLAPTLDAVARERGGRLKVTKMMVFRGPQPLDRIVGVVPRPDLETRLGRLLCRHHGGTDA
jgi:hypothetical protein